MFIIEMFKELKEGIEKNLEYIQYCKIEMENGKYLIMKREDKELFSWLIEKYHLQNKSIYTAFCNLRNMQILNQRTVSKDELFGIMDEEYSYCYYNTDWDYRDFSDEFISKIKTVSIWELL